MTPDEGKAYLNEFARNVRASEAEEMRKGGVSELAQVDEDKELAVIKAKMYEGWKSKAGGWACYVWIASGILWHLILHGPGLLSVSAAVFIGGGMFLASFVLGGVSYGVQRLLVRLLSTHQPPPADSTVQLLGCGKFIVDTGLVVGVSYFVFVTLYS